MLCLCTHLQHARAEMNLYFYVFLYMRMYIKALACVDNCRYGSGCTFRLAFSTNWFDCRLGCRCKPAVRAEGFEAQGLPWKY